MSLAIRRAVPADAGLILSLIRELAAYEKLLDQVQATEEDVVRDLFGVAPRVFCEIADYDGVPAGFALWYYTYSTFRGAHGIWLEDIYVREELRGHGIGKGLLAHLAGICAAEELVRLEWWVLDWNTPSIEFYKSQGAVMQEDWTVCRLDGPALHELAGRGPAHDR